MLTRIRRFIAEAISELRKVSWPTLAQTRNLTVLVFAVSLAVGVFVAVCDAAFKSVLAFLAANFAA